MKLNIPKDYFSNPIAPSVFLCTQSGTRMGELNVYNTSLNGKWNAYSTFNFDTGRTYIDMITGETKIHPLFDKIEGPRTVLVDGGYGYFVIQDDDTIYSDNDSKSISAFSIEYNLSARFLNSFHVNTGEVDSFEVMYEIDKYGPSAKKDNMYKPAKEGLYNPNDQYFHKVYKDSKNYDYEQIQISDENEYKKHFGEDIAAENVLYIHGYANVEFYNPHEPSLSLLHIIVENIPDWKIGHVDYELWHKERRVSEQRIDIYSLFTAKLSDIFECVFEFDTLTKTIDVYAEEEDGLTDDGVAVSKYDTDVYISRESLANEVQISTSTDNIKTRLKVGGSEDLDIREVNLGKNYIMNLDYYHSHKTDEYGNKIPDYEWMEQDLFEQYSRYEEAVEEYSPKYTESMQNWVKAYNSWDDLMNAIPTNDGVLMIGDEFKKLYCTYTPINDSYINVTLVDANINSHFDNLYVDPECTVVINKSTLDDGQTFVVQGYHFEYIKDKAQYKCIRNITTTTALQSLYKKLNLYHVDEDTKANKVDNILLRLQNTEKDIATIRVYCTYKEYTSNTWDQNLQYYVLKENKTDEYAKTYFTDQNDYTEFMKVTNHATLFTNVYVIKTDITRSALSAAEASQEAALTDWIKGKLIVGSNSYPNLNNLEGFKITQIGTLGAYLCLAKQEIQQKTEVNAETYEPTPYLKSFGVRLLREKQDAYMTIFQTQTEGMFSQEKYQCIVSDEKPAGNFVNGTRWIDSDSSPVKLYIYNNGWGEVTSGVGITPEDQASYENYQRYIDNFNKLTAVQEVLADKEREAQYWLDGYPSDRRIDLDDYQIKYVKETTYDKYQTYYDKDGNMLNPQPTSQSDINSMDAYILFEPAQSLEADMQRVAIEHFGKDVTIARVSLDTDLPLYKFTTSVGSSGKFYNSKPSNYKKGDKWIVGADYAPPGIEIKYIKATYYIDGETYYDANGNKLDPQPANSREVQEQNAYVVVHYLLEAKADNKTYSDEDWGEITTYAVYLKGQAPYVSFSNSRGVYQAWMDYYRDLTELESFFDEDQWRRLSPLIRDDEFTDDNFLLNGLESEEERLEVCQELMEVAAKELKTLSQPSLEFSMSMANILALKEFAPIIQQFALGNFIRIELREGLIKKARLLEVNLNFDDLSDFSCVFGNLVANQNQIDLHAELLKSAVQAGRQVAASSSEWQKGADKANKLEEDIATGLQEATLEIGRANGQSIEFGQYGLRGRKLVDGTADQYENEQVALINNKLVFTADGWKTSKAAFGKFTVDGVEHWGVLSDAVISGYIEGATIKGGKLEIGGEGGTFRVNPDGSVEILAGDGNSAYASKDDIDIIKDARRFYTMLEYSGSTVFSEPGQSIEITARVYSFNDDITDKVKNAGGKFSWIRSSKVDDSTWNALHANQTSNIITIQNDDVEGNAQFAVEVQFDDSKI